MVVSAFYISKSLVVLRTRQARRQIYVMGQDIEQCEILGQITIHGLAIYVISMTDTKISVIGTDCVEVGVFLTAEI